MNKSRHLRFFFICICVLCFVGCNQEHIQDNISIDEEYPQGGFVLHSGSPMVETPKGFYAFQGNYLYYITPDLQKSTVLCGKPECTHNTASAYDLYNAAECNAFFQDPQIAYYDGYLYISSTNLQKESAGISDAIYKVSMDGSEKTLFFESEQTIRGLCVYKGKLYIAETVQLKTGNKTSLKQVSFDDPRNVHTLFDTQAYPQGGLNRLECYNDSCYFFFTHAHDDGGGFQYIQLDLKTGENHILFDSNSDTALLYTNEYGSIIEEQDVNRQNELGDWLWDSTYYKIAPGDTKAVPLTEEDFPLLAENPKLENIDDTYVYFSTMYYPTWDEKSWPEDASIYVCTYDGEIAAIVPLGKEFEGCVFHALPGTDDYMFVCSEKYVEGISETSYYYAPKAEFGDGAVVQLKEIPMG